MSRLGDLENAMVDHLIAATYAGGPAFKTVRGISGGTRSAVREMIERERMPVAYVAFVEESINPQTRPEMRGAKFNVFVAARAMRVGVDPRQGTASEPGALALLECARSVLDDWEPSAGLRWVPLLERFIEADERLAVYGLSYRVWPVVEATLRFGGVALAGANARMVLEVGDLEIAQPAFDAEPRRPGFRELTGVAPREIFWRGQLRAPDDAAMNTLQQGIEAVLALGKPGDITDGTGRVFEDCLFERFSHDGPRRPANNGDLVVQDVELQFLQLFSENGEEQE